MTPIAKSSVRAMQQPTAIMVQAPSESLRYSSWVAALICALSLILAVVTAFQMMYRVMGVNLAIAFLSGAWAGAAQLNYWNQVERYRRVTKLRR